MGQTRSIIIGLALVLGQTAVAYAADLGLPPPPPEPCVGCAGPWYLKGFVGAANPDVDDIFAEELLTVQRLRHLTTRTSRARRYSGLGFGYDTGHYFRFDITGEYRGSAVFLANAKYPGANGSFDIQSNFEDETFLPGTNESRPISTGTDEYTADIESWVGLANMYIDLGTWHCVTPYVGGGVGFASIDVIGLKDVNVPNLGVAFAKDNTETNFAWARLCRPCLQSDAGPHHRSLLSLHRSRRRQAAASVPPMTLSATAGGNRDRGHHFATTSCSACAGRSAHSQRRCRSLSNKAPQPSASRLTARLFDGRLFCG